MLSAILFPVSLAGLFFCTVFCYLSIGTVNEPGQAPAIAVLGLMALWFGWLYFRGLKGGEKATPPMAYRSRRLTCGILLSVLAVCLTGMTCLLATDVLRFATPENLSEQRQSLEEARLKLYLLMQRKPDNFLLQEAQKTVAYREKKLRETETAQLRVWLCVPTSLLFLLGSVTLAVARIRKAPVPVPFSTVPAGSVGTV